MARAWLVAPSTAMPSGRSCKAHGRAIGPKLTANKPTEVIAKTRTSEQPASMGAIGFESLPGDCRDGQGVQSGRERDGPGVRGRSAKDDPIGPGVPINPVADDHPGRVRIIPPEAERPWLLLPKRARRSDDEQGPDGGSDDPGGGARFHA